ncbi:NAD(P)-dependent alcohol dehydrogenase [Pseudonocardia halophobica]|uniref:alcohol dehydrogenase n=1 Tax=Pseudonocardia halophobica TaxID=29401 RepID=A0A9W6KY38_9PSEU|nr:NAD(P)-dependent alcohol dehydrogenase [Pseudonocardia halophobica]GLL09803.1 oxidoreductase [Pseudonocardia halophobica]
MKAVRLVAPTVVEVTDVPVPEIGPGDVLVRVGGAGLCHSDVHAAHMPELPFPTPLTLGHEIAGTVAALGSGVDPAAGIGEGTAVVVHLCWSCGVCRACAAGEDNVCEAAGRMAQPLCPGLGPDGGMAEYVRVPARHVVPIGDLDPVLAAPLADAGMTPMHAIRSAQDRLGSDATALVIGVGGLGHVAVQILRATTAARIVAVDVREDRLEAAVRHGADIALLADEALEAVLGLTAGRGADTVLDFAGSQSSVDLAVEAVAPNGAYRLVGILGGAPRIVAAPSLGTGWPWGASLRRTYGGTRSDLIATVALAQRGRISVDVERYPLTEGPAALARLEAGEVAGRAVLVP